MSKSCVYIPKKGRETFLKLKNNFGYDIASVVFNKVRGNRFIRMYKDTLTFDSEGIPTYESILNNEVIIKYISSEKIHSVAEKEFPILEDTRDNADFLIEKAIEYNNKNYYNSIAIVDYTDNNKLKIKIVDKNNTNIDTAFYQYKIHKINKEIAKYLSKAGITIGELSSYETSIGRVGVTDFTKVKNLADNFAKIIRVANNLEGYAAIAEEFSHFILGVYKDSPIVKRAIDFYKNGNNAKEFLGKEYDTISKIYNDNIDVIAEEAAGKKFREILLNYNKEYDDIPLFKRMVNYIVNLFKGIDSVAFQNSIDTIDKELNKFTSKILEKPITKNKIEQSFRNKQFNAISEKVETQIAALRDMTEQLYKKALLQIKNSSEDEFYHKNMANSTVADIKQYLKENESMNAIATFINHAIQDIKEVRKTFDKIDTVDIADKFDVLKNTLTTLQYYMPTIKKLQEITSEEYFKDEDVQTQNFIVSSLDNNLEEFETINEVKTINTSGMSPSQIAAIMLNEGKNIVLSNDKTYYINKTNNEKSKRTTDIIQSDIDATNTFNPDSGWLLPSTNIGTGEDSLNRDFVEGKITKVDGIYYKQGIKIDEIYPNASYKQLASYLDSFNKFIQGEKDKGITLIGRGITVDGIIDALDSVDKYHNIRVAGTVDLLGYDKEGNWYLYDYKTYRSNIDQAKLNKYKRQLTLYKKMLEDKYGIKIKEINIIPIKVSYPKPKSEGGEAEYSINTDRHPLYEEAESNQIKINGEDFKNAKPELKEIIPVSEIELNIDYNKLAGTINSGIKDGKTIILESLKSLSNLYDRFTTDFSEKALKDFIKYIEPFIGESIEIVDTKGDFRSVSIANIIKNSNKDVSQLQRWLTSMADNPDVLLQIFDKIVKIQKEKKRHKTIDTVTKILALGKEYESKGIKNYDFMYEDDNNNYVNFTESNGIDYSYDLYSYNKAKSEFFESLNKKYGTNIPLGSNEYVMKSKEIKEWFKLNTHKVYVNGTYVTIPLNTKYPSKYSKFTKEQKEFYHKWMEIKQDLDNTIGNDKTTLTNTIKIRKSGIERFTNTLKTFKIEDFVNGVKSKFIRSFDDDIEYKDSKSIRGFSGEEIMKLPLYYLHVGNKKDLKDLSRDAISTLSAYAEMAYNYEAMNEVLNPLEIGRYVVYNKRKIRDTKGGKPLTEVFKYKGMDKENPIYKDIEKSKFKEALDDFFESKVYNRYLKDSGEIKGVDVNKVGSFLLKLGSTVQIGFNAIAHATGVLNGIAMHHIEAAAGEFYNARQLFKADTEFAKEMKDYVGDIGQRVQISKLALFNNYFDVKQDYARKARHINFKNRTLLTRLFGPNIQFIGMEAGDFWLYNRTAIAITMNHKLLKDGKEEISLWDALEVKYLNPNNPELGAELVLKNGVTNLDGTEFSILDKDKITGQIRHVNQHLFGIYNEDDSIAARRVILGRFLMQYRDFIPALFRYRFGAKTFNLEKGGKVEGIYRTSYRFVANIIKELKEGDLNLKQLWKELDDYERANVKRTIVELVQWMLVSVMAYILKGGWEDKDPDELDPATRRLYAYSTILISRLSTELGALVPGPMVEDLYKIAKSPFANTDLISDIYSLSNLLIPSNYIETMEGGPYKDKSIAYKSFMESPLTLWYKNIKKTINPEDVVRYY